MPTTLLSELSASGVRFVLVGGLAAVTQGAPITTFDVDIVHDRELENVRRLVSSRSCTLTMRTIADVPATTR